MIRYIGCLMIVNLGLHVLGTIFPLLHPHTHQFGHNTCHILSSQTEQRCARPPASPPSTLILTLVELESTATRIQSDFTPDHADLIDGQRKKQKRRERRLKRFIVSVSGWAVMAWMIYLTVVTARIVPQIWDPYEVLGVSRVSTAASWTFGTVANREIVCQREGN